MKTISDIFKKFGGDQCLADCMGKPRTTVAVWKSRGRIPPRQFPDVISAAKKKRIAGFSYEALHRINAHEAAERPAKEPSAQGVG